MFREDSSSNDRGAGERGQALALFAGGLVALLVATGFVLDGGTAFVARRDAQNAADLGAMAGTRVVAEFHKGEAVSGSDVYASIDKTVTDNGCAPAEPCTWTADYVRPTTGYAWTILGNVADGGAVPSTAQGVAVRVDRNPATSFLRVIGQSDWDIRADATAITGRLEGAPNGIMLPIAFDPGHDGNPRNLVFGTEYKFSEGMDGPGNFSWLSWDDSNDARYLGEIVCEALNPTYTLPTYIPGGPGAKNSSTVRNCLQSFVGKTVYVPLWGDKCDGDPVTGKGSHFDYCIYQVAAFVFTGFESGTGNVAIKNVSGYFVETVNLTDGQVPAGFGPPPCDQDDPGCTSVLTYLGLIS